MDIRNSKKIKIYIILAFFACLSLFAWGSLSRKILTPVQKTKIEQGASPAIKYDEKILQKLKMVSNKLDMSGKEFFLSGSISSYDGADSLQNILDVEYIISKKGQNYYCRFGDTETINTPDVYLFVDHKAKKIMTSASKVITASAGLPDLSSLVKNLRSEEYRLTDEVDGKTEHVSLVNDNHITCKLYRLSFVSESLNPENIYLKLRDSQEPDNELMDKILEIKIKECGQYSDDKKYNTASILKKNGSAWEAAAEYEEYELIVL